MDARAAGLWRRAVRGVEKPRIAGAARLHSGVLQLPVWARTAQALQLVLPLCSHRARELGKSALAAGALQDRELGKRACLAIVYRDTDSLIAGLLIVLLPLSVCCSWHSSGCPCGPPVHGLPRRAAPSCHRARGTPWQSPRRTRVCFDDRLQCLHRVGSDHYNLKAQRGACVFKTIVAYVRAIERGRPAALVCSSDCLSACLPH